MTRQAEEIELDGKVVAVFFPKNIPVEELRFFTDEASPMQIGIQSRTKGTKLTPHRHTVINTIEINLIPEFLYVQSGTIRVDLYNQSNEIFSQKKVSKDEAIVFLDVGHGVELLTDARVLIVKQGPFSQTVHTKLTEKK